MSDEIDPFDPDRLRYRIREEQAKYAARRIPELGVFRRVWEACSKAEQNKLKMALHTLSLVERTIREVTHSRLCAPNIATSTHEEFCTADFERSPIDQELCRTLPLYIDPAEYLCAISCWEDGREYAPTTEGLFLDSHADWPYHSAWDSAEDAPDDTLG